MLEHRPHPSVKPRRQFAAASGVIHHLDAEANLGERNGADVEVIKRLRLNKGHDLGLWPWPPQLRQDVGVEQPTRHNITSRTGVRSRGGSRSQSR